MDQLTNPKMAPQFGREEKKGATVIDLSTTMVVMTFLQTSATTTPDHSVNFTICQLAILSTMLYDI
jgi:hypothetical protein